MKYSKFLDIRKVNNDVIVPAFERARLDEIANSIWECGRFSILYECTTCGTREWKGFRRCKNKFCLCCNTVKSLIWIAKTYKKFEDYLKEGKYIVFLTLTIRDRESLKDGFDILNKAWKNFYFNDKECAKRFKCTFAGGVKSIEVKTGENSELWHPHIHCLLVKDRFSYDKQYIDAAWQKCIELAGGDNDEGITFIESIYMKDENGVKTYDKDALMKGIVETVKYITKFDYANEEPERLQELVSTLKGIRHIDTFGCCRNIQKNVEDEENEQVEIGDVVEHVCQVCGCNEAKLVDMLTERIPTYEGVLLTDELSMPFDKELIEGVKASNGKRTWDGLIKQSNDEQRLEEMYYQSSMFDLTGSSIMDKVDELCENKQRGK